MRMSRHKRKPPANRITIKPQNPAEEIAMMSALVRGLNETVQVLWDTVHELRHELSTVRPAAVTADHLEDRPPTWRIPPATVNRTDRIDILQQQIDELNGDAEYLWFEAQWLRAQLAVSRTGP